MPLDMTSDRGSQFMSSLWTGIAKLLGSQLHHTMAYHQQANVLVEYFHHHLKAAFLALLTTPNWLDELPWVLLDIRTSPKYNLSFSSAELVVSYSHMSLVCLIYTHDQCCCKATCQLLTYVTSMPYLHTRPVLLQGYLSATHIRH